MTPAVWRVEPAAKVLAEAGGSVDVRALLGAEQLARHDRLRQPVDRDDFVAARVLARSLVLAHRGAPTTLSEPGAVRFTQRCASCGGPHGRPTVVDAPGLGVSWAHAKGIVAAAVADGPVGIDVEREAVEPPPGAPGAASEPWLVWTRAEAVTKFGEADLDTSLSWAAHLDGPASSGRVLLLPTGERVWLVDERPPGLGVACSVVSAVV